MTILPTPKTEYYTLSKIDEQALNFLEKVQDSRKRHATSKIIPEKAALLVIDMQRFFSEPTYHAFVPSISAIIPGIKELQNAFLQKNLPVFQTQHGNTLENCGQMNNWWGSINDINDPLISITPELQNTKAEIIKKTQYDAFLYTDLEKKLKDNGITQVLITGVLTHLCCETTARAAFMRGFEVFFVVDGTATYNTDFHNATLLNLSHGFALPVLMKEMNASISNYT